MTNYAASSKFIGFSLDGPPNDAASAAGIRSFSVMGPPAGAVGSSKALAFTFLGQPSAAVSAAKVYSWAILRTTSNSFAPGTGAVILTGYDPELLNVANTFYPPTGGITLTGQIPLITGAVFFDASVTVISQYANSPAILQMVQNFANWIAPGKLLNDFYVLIWNIDSAIGYGLDVWGRIVGVGRVLHVATDALYFGFQEASAGDHVTGFNQAPFYNGQAVTSNFSLSDGAYRQLILAKAAANICNGSIPAINQVLIDIFGSSGNAYVVDNEDMTMVYHFTFPLDPVQEAIVNNSGVLPKPAGVLATVYSP